MSSKQVNPNERANSDENRGLKVTPDDRIDPNLEGIKKVHSALGTAKKAGNVGVMAGRAYDALTQTSTVKDFIEPATGVISPVGSLLKGLPYLGIALVFTEVMFSAIDTVTRQIHQAKDDAYADGVAAALTFMVTGLNLEQLKPYSYGYQYGGHKSYDPQKRVKFFNDGVAAVERLINKQRRHISSTEYFVKTWKEARGELPSPKSYYTDDMIAAKWHSILRASVNYR